MNLIETIEIKNFKSIRHQKIEGCKRINVFIGYPNVGKSNILEALSLFSINETSIQYFSSFVRMEDLTTLFFNGNVEAGLEVRVNDLHRYVAKYLPDRLSFERQYTKDKSRYDDSNGLLKENDQGIDRVKSFGIIEKNQNIVDYASFPFESTIGSILSEIKEYTFKKNISYTSNRYDSLSFPFGENIFAIISGHPEIKKEIESLFPVYNLELVFDTRERKFAILKRTSSGIFSIPYELLADTLQRLIFYKAAILSNTESVLLFEEPEAHMFPPYVSKFASDVWFNKSNQYFITTHSPFVINDFLENSRDELAIFIVDYEKENGETRIKKMTDQEMHDAYQYGLDLFFNIKSFVD